MQNIEEETEVCVPVKTKKVYVYDRTRTKVCCFCGLNIRYDCLARHKKSKKCNIINNLLKDQLAKTEAGIKIVIPEDDYIQDRKNKKDLIRRKAKKLERKE